MTEIYDVAVSFAGEQRQYVEAVVKACKQRNIKVFYDRDKSNDWWGNNFVREQRKVYGSRTRYFVPFLSTEYLAKPIPGDEFSAAMMTAVKQGDGYVLPVLMGNVEVPTDLLHPHIGYLRAEDYTPEQLADELAKKVRGAVNAGQQPRDVAVVVKEAMELRMPKVVPSDFSKYRELDTIFNYLAGQFKAAVTQLQQLGFVGTVNQSDAKVAIRVEHRGDTIYALDLAKGGMFGDDTLEFAIGRNRMGTSGINGWGQPFFDKQSGLPKFKMTDLSVLGGAGRDQVFTKEELFEALWNRIVEQLERH